MNSMAMQPRLYATCLLLVFSVTSREAAAFVPGQEPWRSARPAARNDFVALDAAMEPPLPNFCADCGAASMELRVPPGDERLRAYCASCGRIEYSNPKIVVSCVVLTVEGQQCLLAKRAIEPRKGMWGIPQGFMEHGETSREAASREVLEETGAIVNEKQLRLRGVYNVPGSVQLVYEARVNGTDLEQQIENSTLESSEVRLFPHDDLPHDELCFPTVQWAIDHCLSVVDTDTFFPIQQRTKFYDATRDKWSEFEDEAPPI